MASTETLAAETGNVNAFNDNRILGRHNLYAKIIPIFEDFGFTPPSVGVIARDLSEKIEKAIIQHCESFTKGDRHSDLLTTRRRRRANVKDDYLAGVDRAEAADACSGDEPSQSFDEMRSVLLIFVAEILENI